MYNNCFINIDELFNLWWFFFVDCGFFLFFCGNLILCMYWCLVLVVKIIFLKCVFVEELNWGRGIYEYYKYYEN